MSPVRTTLTFGIAVGIAIALCGPATASPANCDDTKMFACWKRTTANDTKGVQTKWASMPIPYKINAKLIKDSTKKAKAIAAVQAAFTAFEKIPCSNLSFSYAGEETSSFSSVTGYILVYFGDYNQDKASWIAGTSAYNRDGSFTEYYTTGKILWASLGMNAGDYGWYVKDTTGTTDIVTVTGKMIEITTAVMWMIPDALGFYVGTDSTIQDLPILYNSELSAICLLHKQGVQYTYYKADSGCTKPTLSQRCPGGDVVKEGSAPRETSSMTDRPITDGGGGGTGDGSVAGDGTFPPPTDEGCCRVSHARSQGPGLPALALLGLAGVLLLVRARRRR